MILAAVLVAGAAVAATVAAPHAAAWLIHVRPIDRCDLMVVLAGGSKERTSTAAELMSAHACAKVMFTGEGPGDQFEEVRVMLEGLDPSFRLNPPAISRSTFEDAIVALRAARAGGFRSLLVVTSPYHTRRASWIFSRVLDGSGVRFGVYLSTSFYMDYNRWWAGEYGRGILADEYTKLWLCGMAAEIFVARAAAAAR